MILNNIIKLKIINLIILQIISRKINTWMIAKNRII